MGEIDRDLGDAVAARIVDEFATYCGTGVETLVREALEGLSIAGDARFAGARAVGSYWTPVSPLPGCSS